MKSPEQLSCYAKLDRIEAEAYDEWKATPEEIRDTIITGIGEASQDPNRVRMMRDETLRIITQLAYRTLLRMEERIEDESEGGAQ